MPSGWSWARGWALVAFVVMIVVLQLGPVEPGPGARPRSGWAETLALALAGAGLMFVFVRYATLRYDRHDDEKDDR